jgi:hypothetical protein
MFDFFSDIRTEFSARGFSYLSQARADRFINEGFNDLATLEDWPFLYSTITGSSPIDLGNNVRKVLSVASATTKLQEADRDDINDTDPQLAQTGNGVYWWREAETVYAYPNSTTQWTVRTVLYPTDMVAPTDEPAVPGAWRHLGIDFAVIRALRDRSNYQEADALLQAIGPDLERMRDSLIDLPRMQKITDAAA